MFCRTGGMIGTGQHRLSARVADHRGDLRIVCGHQTGATAAAMARSHTWQIIGLPAMSASGFPGRRFAAMRAGMMITGEAFVLMMRQFIT